MSVLLYNTLMLLYLYLLLEAAIFIEVSLMKPLSSIRNTQYHDLQCIKQPNKNKPFIS